MAYVKRKRKLRWSVIIPVLLLMGLGIAYLLYPKQVELENVELPEVVTKEVGPDLNKNGISDIEDIVIGARKDALAMPKYVNAYYGGGYPPEDEGTCTDLVWRAFLEAGYSLKDMVDKDIALDPYAYPSVNGRPDPNIDFRRVGNLVIFFERTAISLTTDVYDTDQWQAGDIVIFGNNEHIGIVSDIRNDKDIPFLIHNNDQADREEDRLEYGDYTMGITAHFRFIPESN
jgi:uncharacterized protein